MDEIEFYEGELELLETPEVLKIFLYSLDRMRELYDLRDLEAYYVDKEMYEFAQVVSDFQKVIDERKD